MHRSLVISRKVQKWCSASVKTAFNFNVSLEKIRNWKQASLRRSLNDVFTPNKSLKKCFMLHRKDKIVKIVADVGKKWKSTVTPLQLLAGTANKRRRRVLLLLAVTGKYLIVSKNPPVTVLVWITQGFMFGVNTPFGTPSLWHHEDWRVLKTKKKLRNWAFWSPSLWLTRITDLQFSDTWQKIKKSILDQLSH